MTGATVTPLVVRRTYPHARDRVFDAFSTGEALEQWLAPDALIATRVLDFEFRVGGRYRFAFTLSGGAETSLTGVYTTIDRPSRLGFSWSWEPPDPHAGIDSFVTVDFIERADGTEVAISHEQLAGPGMKPRHAEGWDGTLNRLEYWLAQPK